MQQALKQEMLSFANAWYMISVHISTTSALRKPLEFYSV